MAAAPGVAVVMAVVVARVGLRLDDALKADATATSNGVVLSTPEKATISPTPPPMVVPDKVNA
jgi:hypothetical protein